MWFDEGIGMDGDEQIRACLACFIDADIKRQVIIAIAGQHSAHAGCVVNFRFKLARDGQCDMFFQGATATACTWIFAAVSGIDGNELEVLRVGSKQLTKNMQGHVTIPDVVSGKWPVIKDGNEFAKLGLIDSTVTDVIAVLWVGKR